MNRIDRVFEELRARHRPALMPFVTAGDPDLGMTADLVRALARCGADLIEVGIPYSDPIADGPVIQASYTRALDRGIKVRQVFDTIRALRRTVDLPLASMVSYSIVYRHGPEAYVAAAREAGFDGAIVPDLPRDEAEELARIAAERDFKLIQLITPTTPAARAVEIARTCSGFIYYVSLTGITGERDCLPAELGERVRWLRRQTPLPVCIGFGISRPEQVGALRLAADGMIVGSAIVRRLAEAGARPRDQVIEEIVDFVGSLLEARDRD